MDRDPSPDEWQFLSSNGYLRLEGAFIELLPTLRAATTALTQEFPYGFADPRYYTGTPPQPLTKQNARSDGRILIPYVGFKNFDILAPLKNARLHKLLERIVGKDFYLSNVWYQEVPPGVARLAYHKDTRGSISFNILLDDIEPGMGSTCLVPGSHINTPPASFCMRDLHLRHAAEVDLVGKAGDLVLFSTETWHARSKHEGQYRTRRLFYNFYSRSSRETTTWADIIDRETIERARATLPSEFGHMFEIDPVRTRQLATKNSSRRRFWAFKTSSADDIIRDFFFAAQAYGKSVDNPNEPGALVPFTTRLTEAREFSAVEYLSNLKLVPSLKNFLSLALKPLKPKIQKLARLVR
jgi:hypothetical protein